MIFGIYVIYRVLAATLSPILFFAKIPSYYRFVYDNLIIMRYFTLILSVFLFILHPNKAFNQVLLPVKKDSKWGLIDTKANFIVSPTYDAISKTEELDYYFTKKGGKVGLINNKGQVIVEPQFQLIKVVDDGLFAVKQNEEWLLIDDNHNVIFNEKHTRVEPIENSSHLRFYWQGKCGLLSREGEVLATAQYDSINLSSQGTFFIFNEAKCGIINQRGELILPLSFDRIIYDSSEFIFAYANHHFGIYDKYGKEIQPTIWQECSMINEQFMCLRKEESLKLLNIKTGKLLPTDDYKAFIRFIDDRYIGALNEKGIGLIDTQGKEILPPRYDKIEPFNNDYFKVKIQNKWGIVQSGDSLVLPIEYELIDTLSGSVSLVKKGNSYGVVNLNGELVLSTRYKHIVLLKNRVDVYNDGGLTVYNFSESGKVLSEYSFSKVGKIKIDDKPTISNRPSVFSPIPVGQYEWYFTRGLWGLRDIETKADIIPPTFSEALVDSKLGLTLVHKADMLNYMIDGELYLFGSIYGIVDNEKGIQIREYDIIDIRFEDFHKKKLPFARVIFMDGTHGLMSRKGVISEKRYAFIGAFENGVARFTKKGQLHASSESNLHTVDKTDRFFNSLIAHFSGYRQPYEEKLAHFQYLSHENGLWGYMDSLGQIVIEPQYQHARDFVNEVAIIEQNNRWGMIDKKGNFIIDCNYNDLQFLPNCDNQLVKVVLQKERVGLIDTLGYIAIPALYDDFGIMQEDRVAVKRGSKWGFCDKNGQEVIACQFDEVLGFSEGLAAFKNERKWGFIDKNGKVVIENIYRTVGNFRGGLAMVIDRSKCQYINKSGQLIIRQSFDKAEDFEQGIARVKEGRYWGLIDINGNYIKKPSTFLRIYPFDENGIAVAQLGNRTSYYTILNKKGEKITTKKYSKISSFSNGFAAVKYKNRYGFINQKGEEVIKATFDAVEDFSEGLAAVKLNGSWGYINTAGRLIVEPIYSKVLPFKNGFGVVYQRYKSSGLVNQQGEVVIEPIIDKIIAFSEGGALVRSSNYQYSFITIDNNYTEGTFQEALPFQHHIAIVKQQNRWGMLSKEGVELVPFKYDKIEPFKNAYAKFTLNTTYCLMNLKGEPITPSNCEEITHLSNGIFQIISAGEVGYYSNDEGWIWPQQ